MEGLHLGFVLYFSLRGWSAAPARLVLRERTSSSRS